MRACPCCKDNFLPVIDLLEKKTKVEAAKTVLTAFSQCVHSLAARSMADCLSTPQAQEGHHQRSCHHSHAVRCLALAARLDRQVLVQLHAHALIGCHELATV